MSEFIKDVLRKWREDEKNILIRQSGSTKDSHNEKVRAGQSYLYKRAGMESEVIEVRFKDKVSGSWLNQALIPALERYPYFNTKLIEKDGDFYIVQNPVSMVARRTRELARLGNISCGYHLVDITYYDDSVYISFHHALCDGRGIKPFIETLIYYYCNLRYKVVRPADGVRLAEDPLLPGETADPFAEPYAYDDSREFPQFSRDAFAVSEIGELPGETDYRYEVTVPHGEFMEVCKAYHATPVILLALLMNHGLAALYPDYDKPIHANIAADIRKALDLPNTYKNCVCTMVLPYDRDFSSLTVKEQAEEYRQLLAVQRDRDNCRRSANQMMGLSDKLDTLPSYEEKQGIMSFFEGMRLDTYIISYLGQFALGECEQYIKEIHLYNSGAAGFGINMISVGDLFCIDFKQSFASDRYVQAFCRELAGAGLEYTVSEGIPFFTPADSMIKR